MPATDPHFHAGHRERLRQKFLDGKITDYELLESLLGYAIPRRDVRPLARGLVEKFGSVAHVFAAEIDDLLAYRGIGRSTAIFLKLVHRAVLLDCRMAMDKRPIFHNTQILHNYCKMMLMSKQTEELHVLYLDANKHLLLDETHTTGSNSTSVMYPNKIVQQALNLSATSIILVHNHPNITAAFSDDDLKSTAHLESLIAPLGITLYDHFLIAGANVLSMRNVMSLMH